MENLSKIITISAIESKSFDTATQYKIKAGNETFKFYTLKKDGNETVAYKQFKDMGLKIGSMVEVWYKEEQKEYQGKPYTDRLIASFREAGQKPVAPVKQQNAPRQEIKYEADKVTDWDSIAVGKTQSLFLAAFIQSGKSFSEAKLQVTQARQLAELVVYGTQKTDETDEEDEDYTGDIPF